MDRTEFDVNKHMRAPVVATVNGGKYIIDNARGGDGTFDKPYNVAGRELTQVKPLYSYERETAAEIEKVNDILNTADVKRRFVCFPCGDKYSAEKIINAADNIGFSVTDVVWAMEKSGGDDIPALDSVGRSLCLVVYDVQSINGVLSITACGYAYRDYSASTWQNIAAVQESAQADNVAGYIDGVGAVYNKPTAEQMQRLYDIETSRAPLIVPNNAKGIERDIKAYAAALALFNKAYKGYNGVE